MPTTRSCCGSSRERLEPVPLAAGQRRGAVQARRLQGCEPRLRREVALAATATGARDYDALPAAIRPSEAARVRGWRLRRARIALRQCRTSASSSPTPDRSATCRSPHTDMPTRWRSRCRARPGTADRSRHLRLPHGKRMARLFPRHRRTQHRHRRRRKPIGHRRQLHVVAQGTGARSKRSSWARSATSGWRRTTAIAACVTR